MGYGRRRDVPRASLQRCQDGMLAFRSPYDPNLVTAFKAAVPWADRKWDRRSKVWIVAPKYARAVAALVRDHLRLHIDIPVVAAREPGYPIVRMEYLGAAHERDDTTFSSLGWSEGDWTLVFPYDVLQTWFDPSANTGPTPSMATTLYAILGARRDVPGDGLRKAYRRAARAWHPDVCKESDAGEQFIRIKAAYDLLSNPGKRARYDAGLALERQAAKPSVSKLINLAARHNWKPPIRCGLLLFQGMRSVRGWNVRRILQWEDVQDERGRTLVTFWAAGDDSFTRVWRK